MKAALDVSYRGDLAIASCVVFKEWQDSEPLDSIRAVTWNPPAYQPGRFYRRELPCLLEVLEKADMALDALVIDGYVHLKAEVGLGLGAYLRNSLDNSPVVVGVAKNPLKIADRFVPVYRGKSEKPLFVSAAGCDLEEAANSIARMHGRFRIPTLLTIADRFARPGGTGRCC